MTEPTQRMAMKIDAYGRYARQSALADYLEVAALEGRRITEAALARAIEENGWAGLPRRQFLTLANTEEDPEAWAQATFTLVRDRQNTLALHYPFDFNRTALVMRVSPDEARVSAYIALLAIAVLHAWKLDDGSLRPEDVLESLVARALENRGLRVSRMGVHDRETRSFVDAVVLGGKHLGLEPMPDPLPRKASAKDAGIDTLAGLTWADGRRGGQWLFIGQATVGESPTWERKLGEPPAGLWADYMQEALRPQPFLAVPHHVHEEHMEVLTKSCNGLVLDRLRLCPFVGEPSDDERGLIERLFMVQTE